jgi:hypothetical protein
MHSATFFSSTSSGTLPPRGTVSSNALRSYRPERRHDLDAGARRVRQPLRINRPDAIEIPPHLIGDSPLSVGRSIAELRSERGAGAGIDAQRGRGVGEQRQQVFADAVEFGMRIRLALGA